MKKALAREVQPAAITREEVTADLQAGRLALWCDLPPAFEVVSDGLLVTGWAFGASGVSSVTVVIDSSIHREAKLGVTRGDTVLAFPQIEGIERAGFTCGIPESVLTPGEHLLVVVATDGEGRTLGTARQFSYRDRGAGEIPPPDRPWSGERLEPDAMPPHPATGEHHARYRWATQVAAGRSVLDAGCGVGWGSVLLAEAGGSSVTGVDISPGAIDRARRGAPAGIEFVVGDLQALPFEAAAFDLVVCFEAIEHVRDPERALDELRRVLRPDGLLLVSSPNRGVYDTPNPWHVREYTSDELASTLATRFANVAVRRQQTHFASALTGDEALQADGGRAVDAQLLKLVGGPPGSELFAVAAASDAQLPRLEDLVLLGDLCPGFVEQATAVWRERAGRAEAELAAARRVLGDAQCETRELTARLRVSGRRDQDETPPPSPSGPVCLVNRPTPAASPVAEVATFWGSAISAVGIERVEVAIAGRAPVRARDGISRPDMAAAFPTLPSAATSGWMASLDVSELPQGVHSFEVTAYETGGQSAVVPGAIEVDPDLCYRIWREVRADDPPLGPVTEPCHFLVCALAGPAGAEDRLSGSLAEQAFAHWERAATAEIGAALAAVAGGEADFVLFTRSCDRLAPDALLAFAARALGGPRPDVLYGDDDRLAPDGTRTTPRLKPGWSPELLREHDYIGPCVAIGPRAATAALERGAGADAAVYDLLLRLVDVPLDVARVPRVLCSLDDSEAERRPARSPRDRDPLVSVVMPTLLSGEPLEACLSALREGTSYRPLELILIDTTPDGLPPLGATTGDIPLTVLRDEQPFNFSRACNLGAAAASGEYVLLLNDDVTPLVPDWLDALVEQGLRPGVGAVGAKLLYPGGSVQHAGLIVHPPPRGPAHLLSDLPGDAPGPGGRLLSVRNVSAVTGACMLVRAADYDGAGGLDESFPLDYGDVDFCLRLLTAGKRIVWTPHALLEHVESASGARAADPAKLEAFHARWGEALAQGDPYYNPGLNRELHFELLGAVA